MKHGDCVNKVLSSTPYGYMKDPEDKNHWIIDEEAAEIVRRIFQMTMDGVGPFRIAQALKADKIDIQKSSDCRTALLMAFVSLA